MKWITSTTRTAGGGRGKGSREQQGWKGHPSFSYAWNEGLGKALQEGYGNLVDMKAGNGSLLHGKGAKEKERVGFMEIDPEGLGRVKGKGDKD